MKSDTRIQWYDGVPVAYVRVKNAHGIEFIGISSCEPRFLDNRDRAIRSATENARFRAIRAMEAGTR